MENKVLDKKQALKKAALERLKQPFELQKIRLSGDFDLYARQPTVAEVNQREQLIDEIEKTFTNYIDERILSLRLLDKNGQPYFDYKNDDDMLLLHNIPLYIKRNWFFDLNNIEVTDSILKNLLPTDNQP